MHLPKRDNCESFDDYLRQFKLLCDELAAIGKASSEDRRTFWMLQGLGRHYQMFTTMMLCPPMPQYSELISLLTSFETRISNQNASLNRLHQAAYVAQRTNKAAMALNKKSGFSSKKRGFLPAITTNSTCADEVKAGSMQLLSPSTVSLDQNLISKNKLICQICLRTGHPAYKCWFRFNKNFVTLVDQPSSSLQTSKQNTPVLNKQAEQPQVNFVQTVQQAMSALQISDVDLTNWLPDSGASSHMTGTLSLLHSVEPYDGKDAVMIGNGDMLPITHIGTATISIGSDQISLSHVLYVPKLRQNLLSIGQLTRDNDCDIIFSNDGFSIINRSDGRVIARGNRAGSLYQLAPTKQMALFSTRQQRVSPSTWHSRFGHCNMNIVHSLVKQGLLSITSVKSALSSICNSCQFAKSKLLVLLKRGLCILLRKLSVICGSCPSSINKTRIFCFICG